MPAESAFDLFTSYLDDSIFADVQFDPIMPFVLVSVENGQVRITKCSSEINSSEAVVLLDMLEESGENVLRFSLEKLEEVEL